MEIAARLGYPVVLKVASPQIHHKTEAGGVIPGLANAEDVKRAYSRIMRKAGKNRGGLAVEGIMVCKQAPPGLEVIVGMTHDRVFGPTVMFGLGGIFTEILRDTAFRTVPLSPEEAGEMIREIRGYPVLAGTRGQPGYDTKALAVLIHTVAKMVVDHPEIKELDLNPVRLFHHGLKVLDVALFLYNDCEWKGGKDISWKRP